MERDLTILKYAKFFEAEATDGELHWFEPTGDIASPVDGDTNIPIIDARFIIDWILPIFAKKKFRMMITYNNIKRPKENHSYRVSFCKFKMNSWGKAYSEDFDEALYEAVYKVIQNDTI